MYSVCQNPIPLRAVPCLAVGWGNNRQFILAKANRTLPQSHASGPLPALSISWRDLAFSHLVVRSRQPTWIARPHLQSLPHQHLGHIDHLDPRDGIVAIPCLEERNLLVAAPRWHYSSVSSITALITGPPNRCASIQTESTIASCGQISGISSVGTCIRYGKDSWGSSE